MIRFVTELCVLRTFGGVVFSLNFICAQSVPEFLWDRLRASIQFHVMPKRAQYARFGGEDDIALELNCTVGAGARGRLARRERRRREAMGGTSSVYAMRGKASGGFGGSGGGAGRTLASVRLSLAVHTLALPCRYFA
eukprot:COSAG02_NODE_6650_length_3436_cov_3.932673_2_plen_137_part_00